MKFTSCAVALVAVLSIMFSSVAQAAYSGLELTVNALPGERRSEAAVMGPDTHYGDDSATEVTVMYRFKTNPARPAAFVIGLGLDVIAVDYGKTAETLYGFRVEPGIAIRINDQFRVEGHIALAIGSSSALWGQEAVMLRPVYQLESGLSLHAQIGYTHMGTLFSDVNDETSTTSRSGIVFGAGLGYQFR